MITSKNNELIKKCIQLKTKKYSKEYALCFIESIKLVKELYNRKLIENILVVEDKFSEFSNINNVEVDIISTQISQYLSDTITTDGVFAICRIPTNNNFNFNRIVLLDRIQDPSNLGAIIRSACAFNYDIISINSVYPYSSKAIRSSMGQIFNVNYLDLSLEEVIDLKNKYGIRFITADMDGMDVSKAKVFDGNIAIIIGNEGQGVSNELSLLSDETISIPMDNNVESLNASVSAGIIMYLLK